MRDKKIKKITKECTDYHETERKEYMTFTKGLIGKHIAKLKEYGWELAFTTDYTEEYEVTFSRWKDEK